MFFQVSLRDENTRAERTLEKIRLRLSAFFHGNALYTTQSDYGLKHSQICLTIHNESPFRFFGALVSEIEKKEDYEATIVY